MRHLAVKRDRAVLRDCPRRRRPDDDTNTRLPCKAIRGLQGGKEISDKRCILIESAAVKCAFGLPFRHTLNHRKPHPDRVAGVVVVFHLGLGQRGLFHRAPHHRLAALIQRAVHQEFHEFLGNHRFRVEIHRAVGVGPVAGDPQPLEFLALDIDPALGETAAFLAEIHHINVVLVQPLGAVLFLDLPLDRQAVAIPARHVARVTPHHLLAAHHHVFQDLVQRVADVQMTVGVGRAVVQDEGLSIFRIGGLFAQPVINPDRVPACQPFRLARRKAGAHRKIGFGQEHGSAVVGHVGAHRMRTFRRGWMGRGGLIATAAGGVQQMRLGRPRPPCRQTAPPAPG